MGHGTCAGVALKAALQYSEKSTAARKVIIFISDGYMTCPGLPADEYSRRIVNEITGKNAAKVEIHSLIFGEDEAVSTFFPSELSRKNNGTFTRIKP
ncbi:MAG: hypothetical protein HY717_01060 [Planctomycetes bacterium]|nr:hypothetical protein [Planctomycetota bacterium]